MTDEEIIKALECCGKNHITGSTDACEHCFLQNGAMCVTELIYKALDLINRQQEEIKDLKIVNEHLVTFNIEAQAEIERLQTENNKLNDDVKVYKRLQRDRDIVSYDDFKKSIIDECIGKLLKVRGSITLADINEIRKEMVGEGK